ncbi:MAG: putative inorganic carbon transporter subunit DabA, partial [Candidatus Methylomirabilales bacterium]
MSGRGPIITFVHENPIHGLQRLPFDWAVREAQRLLGGQGYLSNEAFRRLYASGRVTRNDLLRTLEAQVPHLVTRPPIEVRGRTVEAREVLLAHLLHEITPLPHGTLRWQVTQAKATRRFRPDLPSETRAGLLDRAWHDLQVTPACDLTPRYLGTPGTLPAIQRQCQRELEAYAVSTLWAAVLAKLGLGDPGTLEDQEAHATEALAQRVLGVVRDGGMAIHLTEEEHLGQRVLAGLRPGELSRDGFQALERLLEMGGADTRGREEFAALRRLDPRADLVRSAQEALERDLGRIGPEATLGEFCARLTGAQIPGMI